MRINIRDWKSPVAKQHGIKQLPTVHLYRGRKRIGSGAQAVYRELR